MHTHFSACARVFHAGFLSPFIVRRDFAIALALRRFDGCVRTEEDASVARAIKSLLEER